MGIKKGRENVSLDLYDYNRAFTAAINFSCVTSLDASADSTSSSTVSFVTIWWMVTVSFCPCRQSKRRIPEFLTFDNGFAADIRKKWDECQAVVRKKLRRAGVYYAYLEDLREIPETVTLVLNGEITD